MLRLPPSRCRPLLPAVVLLLAILPSGSPGAAEVRPGDPIVVQPSQFGVESPDRVAVELDGVDVTRYAGIDGERIVIRMPTEIPGGMHNVTLFEATADGWMNRGGFDFEVRQSYATRTLRGRAGATTDLVYRARDNGFDIPADVDRWEGTGSFDLRGRYEEQGFHADLYAPLFYDSEGKKDWDLGSFRLEAGAGPLTARLGHHAPGPSSLVLEGFNRRGISVDLDSPVGLNLSTFVYRSDPITGFRESFGISDEARRLLGTSVTTDPIPIPFGIGEIELGATYYRATGDEGGTGVGVVDTRVESEKGSVYDFLANVALFDRRIELTGEWARSDHDLDGGGPADYERDTAWTGLAIVTPFVEAELGGQPIDLQLLYEERETGSVFRALGNPGLPTDLWMRTANVVFYWAGFDLSLLHVRSRDNRDDDRRRSINRSDTWAVDASYTPHWLAEPREDWLRWLGTPTARAGWSRDRTKPLANEQDGRTLDLGALFLAGDGDDMLAVPSSSVNDTARVGYLGLGSRWQRFDFEGSYTETRFDDATGLSADSQSKSIAVDVNVRPHRRLTLGGGVQRDVSRLRDPAFKTTSHRVNTNLRANLLPGRLDWMLRGDWDKTVTSDRSADQRRALFSSTLDWHVTRADGVRPGLTLTLYGVYQDVMDASARGLDRDAYQVFLKGRVSWWGSLPGGGR